MSEREVGTIDILGVNALIISPIAYFALAMFVLLHHEHTIEIIAAGIFFILSISAGRLIFIGIQAAMIQTKQNEEYDWEKEQK